MDDKIAPQSWFLFAGEELPLWLRHSKVTRRDQGREGKRGVVNLNVHRCEAHRTEQALAAYRREALLAATPAARVLALHDTVVERLERARADRGRGGTLEDSPDLRRAARVLRRLCAAVQLDSSDPTQSTNSSRQQITPRRVLFHLYDRLATDVCAIAATGDDRCLPDVLTTAQRLRELLFHAVPSTDPVPSTVP